MTQLDLQNTINTCQPDKLPSLQAFGINDREVVIAAFGLKGTVKWEITGGKISTIRGLRTRAFCVKAIPTDEKSTLTVEDEIGTKKSFDLSYLLN